MEPIEPIPSGQVLLARVVVLKSNSLLLLAGLMFLLGIGRLFSDMYFAEYDPGYTPGVVPKTTCVQTGRPAIR